MFFRFAIAAALASTCYVYAEEPFHFCTDYECDVFGNSGFNVTEQYIQASIAVPQQDSGCFLILKSPADTSLPGCGLIQNYFGDEICGNVELHETFMVQFCCGDGDCSAAGIPGQTKREEPLTASAKFSRSYDLTQPDLSSLSARSGSGARSLKIAMDGKEVEPIYVGPPLATSAADDSSPSVARRGVCNGVWTPQAGLADYTRPADGSEVVSQVYTGPVTVAITKSRTTERSTTIEASLGFEDILSLGISFSSSITKGLETSEQASYPIPAGETGSVAWTAFWRCTTGSGTCNGATVTGEVCTPYNDASSGDVAGEFSVAISET
ncbi:hypothetical protein F5Y16DRAFT_395402 [Xylariaceae sp. FL0255]|nr:hypothetical protein F5Y16DRAFT_395402 [Xylariaceae sp. FL0255]